MALKAADITDLIRKEMRISPASPSKALTYSELWAILTRIKEAKSKNITFDKFMANQQDVICEKQDLNASKSYEELVHP